MPAPAVIPAPRAYINAVAVKGFVVELRAVKEIDASRPPDRRPLLLQSVNVQKQTSRERSLQIRVQCTQGAPVCLTVTKKARPKQSLT